MKRYMLLLLYVVCQFGVLHSQSDIQIITELDLSAAPAGKISKYYLHLVDNGLGQPVYVPIMVAKGREEGPVLGLTAAIHGNELNGIPIIQEVFQQLDLESLRGTVVGVPGLNVISLNLDSRRFVDDEDLNRAFPGKENGNRSEQYAFRIFDKIVRHFDYQIDMHTASFGRINSLYVRADMADEKMAKMAVLQDADIILDNKGIPSAGASASSPRTLRAEAVLNGIPTITVEYGDPQVYQPEMTQRGVVGVFNTLQWLEMVPPANKRLPEAAVWCKKSYWVYTTQGGLLDIPVELKQQVAKGQVIGVLKNAFGDVIDTYYAPEAGIVIGKSTNPVNMTGGRIIHLGILK
ncbi:succinylglutamate desuccinylase/aspartoacylase family protein [Lewinella sp. LCG006]|uniref:succinylglutamate desuccinylase/aspartoacylase family protein n=1 Tax=Lewinella sp. LCG006 TaxID=3231911 RepID=UPI00345FF027